MIGRRSLAMAGDRSRFRFVPCTVLAARRAGVADDALSPRSHAR